MTRTSLHLQKVLFAYFSLVLISSQAWAMSVPQLEGTVYFDENSAELAEEERMQLKNVACYLMASGNSIEVDAYASADEKAPDLLSQQRARVVEHYLAESGVPKGKIAVASYGKNRPVASDSTPDGRVRNRRAEFSSGPPGQASCGPYWGARPHH